MTMEAGVTLYLFPSETRRHGQAEIGTCFCSFCSREILVLTLNANIHRLVKTKTFIKTLTNTPINTNNALFN